jgi:hypothetical protein
VFSLLCAALHPCIPGLTPGVSIGLNRTLGGGLTLQIPMTATVAGMILAAIKDGALVPDGPRDEFWNEMESGDHGDPGRAAGPGRSPAAQRPGGPAPCELACTMDSHSARMSGLGLSPASR